MSEQFEVSKKVFIDTVAEAYKKFLKDNGRDLEKEIRKKLIKERRIRREQNYRLKEQELIANEMFLLEYEMSEQIQEFYGDLNDIDLDCEWYISEGMLFIKFTWNEYEMILSNKDGKAKLSGGPKKLRVHLKNSESLKKFVELDKRYYMVDEGFKSSVKL
jgi:GTP1/Obg family GTP-binding protein